MPFYHHPKEADKTIFHSHIPKTGGESIRQAMIQSNCRVSFYSGYAEPCSFQHRERDDSDLQYALDILKPCRSFTVVREPQSRLYSIYAWQMMICGAEMSQESFDWWLMSARAAVKENRHAFDNHMRPQVEFIPRANQNPLPQLLCFGKWGQISDYLSDWLGQPVNLGHFHKLDKPSLEISEQHKSWFQDFYGEDIALWQSLQEKNTPCANHNSELP